VVTSHRYGDLAYKRIKKTDLASKIMPIELQAYSHPWTESIFESCLDGSYEAWMMLQNRKVLGYGVISAYSGEGHLLNLCVNPTCQGKGLGRQLLAYLVAKVKQLGASVLFLEVRSSNVAAIELYYSEGFNELAVRKGYYPSANGREDALLMSLELSIDDYC
jgi:ribosomal-protein-alanine N-acetyltransferase